MSIRRGDIILAGAGSANPDNNTINLNERDKIQAIGTINKNLVNGSISSLYNWVGTLEEYTTQNIETLHPEWVCYITDDFNSGNACGLKVGDIGISAFGIDETQNTRRYLNGQIISQSQFVAFTTKLKEAVILYPSIVTTEVAWQESIMTSALGQCGKFVIDDIAGTIRLPKVVNIQGLQDLTGLGNLVEAGLPNITGYVDLSDRAPFNGFTDVPADSAIYQDSTKTRTTYASNDLTKEVPYSFNFDASRSSSIYGNSNTVQLEAIRYPYFIQVAEGVETLINASRQIDLNNPFSLLDYKFSEYEISNASWLLSNGQFNNGEIYSAVYDLLTQIYAGTVTKAGVSVKLSTETYADTDFVLNVEDITFRLPTKVKLASGKAIAGNGMALGLTNGTNNSGLQVGSGGTVTSSLSAYGHEVQSSGYNDSAPTGIYGITTDLTKSGIETSSSGLYLYFYVGDTVQDANIIATSAALTTISNLTSCHAIIDTYINGTSWYRVYSDGWCEQGGYLDVAAVATATIDLIKIYADTNYSILITNLYSSAGSKNAPHIMTVSTSSFTYWSENTNGNIYWQTSGYLADGEY